MAKNLLSGPKTMSQNATAGPKACPPTLKLAVAVAVAVTVSVAVAVVAAVAAAVAVAVAVAVGAADVWRRGRNQ